MESQTNSELVRFIKEARKRGFEDWQIREPLIQQGWFTGEIKEAFEEVKEEENKKLKKKQVVNNKVVYVYKNSITIHLDSDIIKIIEKRAKKNMLTPTEQIEDIIRRSCINTKKKTETQDNVDDLFLKLFSRKASGRPRKG